MSLAAAPLPPAAVPAAVRAEGPAAARSYEAALGFERLLLTQLLTQALPEEGEGEGSEGEGEGAAPRAVGMPETLAAAIVAAGGTGLAADVYRPAP